MVRTHLVKMKRKKEVRGLLALATNLLQLGLGHTLLK